MTYLLENPDATTEDLLRLVSGPDFPTGGIIMGRAGIKQAYATGHGKVVVRARHTFEEAANGRERIIVDELPYAVNKANREGLIMFLAFMMASVGGFSMLWTAKLRMTGFLGVKIFSAL